MRAFGYSLIAFDSIGVNVYFVLDSELGAPPPAAHTFAALTPNYNSDAWRPLHHPCKAHTWVHVAAGGGLAQADFMRLLRPAVLSHKDGPSGARIFYEAEAPGVLVMHRHRRWHQGASAGGGGAAATRTLRVGGAVPRR
jgi:hypothetical protein